MDVTRKRMSGRAKRISFYSTYDKKPVQAAIDRIDERKKGGWIAYGKDAQGRKLTKFVARGTKA